MYFKYLGTRDEIGVKVFGMVHGLVFMPSWYGRCRNRQVEMTLVAGVAGSIVPWQCDLPCGRRRRTPRPIGPAFADVTNLVRDSSPPSIGPAWPARLIFGLKQPPPRRVRRRRQPPAVSRSPRPTSKPRYCVRSNQMPVVVLLWSPRSEVQRATRPTILSGSGRRRTAASGRWPRVNVDAAPRVAQMFGVQAVPTVVALAGGQPLSELPGAPAARAVAPLGRLAAERDRGQARRWTPRARAEEVDPELAQAREHLDAGDFDAALDAYQAILDANPNHAEAKGAVRQIAFLQRATAQRPDAIAAADAAPDDIDAAFAAADVQLLQQDVAGAFDRLIALVKRTAGDERTSVRTRLIELFELFDAADPEVIAGRRNLANALY